MIDPNIQILAESIEKSGSRILQAVHRESPDFEEERNLEMAILATILKFAGELLSDANNEAWELVEDKAQTIQQMAYYRKTDLSALEI